MNEKEKGNECFRVGDYEEAVVYYSRSLDAVDTTAVHNNRALTHLKAKHYIKAMVDLSIVLEAEPTNVKALLRQANALKGANRHTEALASANRVLELKPENKEATALKKELAKLAPAKKTPAKRMVIEEDSSSDEDEEGDAVTVHVDERESMKKAATPTPTPAPTPASTSKRIMIEEDSEDDSEDGSEDDEDVAPTTTAAAATTPAKAEPEPAATTGSGAEATTSFSDPAATPATEAVTAIKAPTPTPTSTPAPIIEDDETPADVLKLKDGGKDMFIQGNYAEAADKYSAALSALRSSGARCTKIQVALLSNRATCQLKIGQCSKCITDCDAVLHLDTSHAKAMLTRASANETKESFRKAFLDYKAVIEAYPSNKTASMGLARVTRMIEDLEGNAWVREQRGKTSVALTRAPGSSPMASPLQPRKTEGATTAAVKKPAASAAAVKRAAAPVAEDDGSSAAAQLAQAYDDLKAKGNTCVKEKRYDQAVNCYTQCVNLDATKAAALNNRALCYLKLSQWNQSITDCESVLTLEPNNSKAMYRKAQGFVGLGHTEDARAAYRECLANDPKNTKAAAELAALPEKKGSKIEELADEPAPKAKIVEMEQVAQVAQAKPESTVKAATANVAKKAKALKKAKKSNDAALERMTELRAKLEKEKADAQRTLNETASRLKKCAEVVEVQSKDLGAKEKELKQASDEIDDGIVNISEVLGGHFVDEVAKAKTEGMGEAKDDSAPSTPFHTAPSTPAKKPETVAAATPKKSATPAAATPKKTSKATLKKKAATPQSGASTPSKKVTSMQFMRQVTSLSSKPDALCEYLLTVPAKRTRALFSNRLEADHLVSMLSATSKMDPKKAFTYLQHLTEVARFGMVYMFLGDADKQLAAATLARVRVSGDADAEQVEDIAEKYE